MYKPLKIYDDGSFRGVKEIDPATTAWYEIFKVVLEDFASDTSLSGHIKINDNFGGYGTLIGTFVDTWRPYTDGEHPVGTNITSTTYNLFQNLYPSNKAGLVRPLELDGLSGRLREMDDSDMFNHILPYIANEMITYLSAGTYVLQPSAPSGGTWVSVGTIQNFTTPTSSNTTKLWLRTDTSSSTTVRPIKSGGGGDMQEMTDADLRTWTNWLREYIRVTGIGQYRFQSSTPSGGTWITSGAAFEDTRRQVANETYTGTYTGYYTGAYTGYYTGSYTLYYSGRVYGYYTGTYTGYYSGAYTGNYSGNYTGLTIQTSDESVSSVKLWLRTA